jgi:exoribonuclease-2
MLSMMRAFELTYDAYAEAQRTMERYWSLVFLRQQGLATIDGEVIRDNLVRLDGVPVVARVPSLPELAPGVRVRFTIERIDLYDLLLDLVFKEEVALS